ncbi:alkyl sulfatase dimerization domain-containing protein [Microbacterium sp. MYb43]|uniref:alkyl sulfatase dimerization domain-containing protein n=1 Tax=unclassified Microbacterium TaxID=2609290 RepID=UPI0035BEA1E8
MSAVSSPRNSACGTATRCHCPPYPGGVGQALRRPHQRRQDPPGGQARLRRGDYRWAAEILHKLVFAQPDGQDAKNLQADAYEQMGYQTEAPQWRGIFLTARPRTAGGRHGRSVQHGVAGHHPGDAARRVVRLRRRAHHR